METKKLYIILYTIQTIMTLSTLFCASLAFLDFRRDANSSELTVTIFTTAVAGFAFIATVPFWFVVLSDNEELVSSRVVVIHSSALAVLFLNAAVFSILNWKKNFLLADACLAWATAIAFVMGLPIGLKRVVQEQSFRTNSFKLSWTIGRLMTMVFDTGVMTSSGVILIDPSASQFKVHGFCSLIVGAVGIVIRFAFFLSYIYNNNAANKKSTLIANTTINLIWIPAYCVISSIFISLRHHPALFIISGFCSACVVALFAELVRDVNFVFAAMRLATSVASNEHYHENIFLNDIASERENTINQTALAHQFKCNVGNLLETSNGDDATKKDMATEQTAASKCKDAECSICLQQEGNILLWPCKHYPICEGCAEKLETCHVCRAPIQQRLKIFHA